MADAVGGVPALLAGLAATSPAAFGLWAAVGSPTTVPEAAGLLAWFYPDGSPTAAWLRDDPGARKHRDLRQLMEVLRHRSDAPADKPRQIDVRIVYGPDGTTPQSVIIDIPGTSAWNVTKPTEGGNLQDWWTNVHAAANHTTTYQLAIGIAIADALERAQVPDGAQLPVMLVGHSQGATVALQAAGGLAGEDRFHVTHVVAAGANGSNVDVPSSVRVLALENRWDTVSGMDAATNPDGPNWTTLTVDRQLHDAGENHKIQHAYYEAAEIADHSSDPSLRAYRESAGAFLNDNRVDAYVYDVRRR